MERRTQVCVTRHGETEWNKAGILQGTIDVPLNEDGRRQARELAAAFADAGFAAVFSSPLVRARETAEIIADTLGLAPPTCCEDMKERNFGVIQGIPKAELGEKNPVLLRHIAEGNPAAHFENGEGGDEFAERVLDAVLSIGKQHAGDRVLVVTHGWVMDVITRHIRGLRRDTILNVRRNNGECLWLEVDCQSTLPASGKRYDGLRFGGSSSGT